MLKVFPFFYLKADTFYLEADTFYLEADSFSHTVNHQTLRLYYAFDALFT